MEGLSLGVSAVSLNSKSVLPPIGSARKNSFTKQDSNTSTSKSSNTNKRSARKPETSPRAAGMGMGIAGINMNSSENPPRSSQGKVVASSAPANTQSAGAKGSGKPTKMQRAKHWSPEAENAYRFQSAGFRDQVEYEETHPSPEFWEETGFVRQLSVKTTGFFMYFRQTRECEDKYLGKTKLYFY